MFEISFKYSDEARVFYHILKKSQLNENGEISIILINTSTVIVSAVEFNEGIKNWYMKAILHFFLFYKEDKMILSILQNQFYYEDESEQQEILNIAQSIMEGERTDIPKAEQFNERVTFILQALEDILIEGVSFSLESLLTFRLHHYHRRMIKYVELAIEEYKMEQDYQSFIQGLRDYIVKNKPIFSEVHILHEGTFILMNKAFVPFTKEELNQYIDEAFVNRHPMYIDSNLIAPLISISPKRILLYANDLDNGMVRTIQNIFQERVIIFPKSYLEFIKTEQSK